jgi:hypothetical protein
VENENLRSECDLHVSITQGGYFYDLMQKEGEKEEEEFEIRDSDLHNLSDELRAQKQLLQRQSSLPYYLEKLCSNFGRV